jgi:hypothetical protein
LWLAIVRLACAYQEGESGVGLGLLAFFIAQLPAQHLAERMSVLGSGAA